MSVRMMSMRVSNEEDMRMPMNMGMGLITDYEYGHHDGLGHGNDV